MQVCQSHKHSSDADEYDLQKDDIGDCMKKNEVLLNEVIFAYKLLLSVTLN